MKFTKQSTISGKFHTMEIPVTMEQLYDWDNGMLIQDAMPNLTPEQREFIKTGITPEEWRRTFNDN